MSDVTVSGFAPTAGLSKRAQRHKQARLYDGEMRRRPTTARSPAWKLTQHREFQRETVSHPLYAVRPIRESQRDASTRYGATVREIQRVPKRVVPECEKPSNVITTKLS